MRNFCSFSGCVHVDGTFRSDCWCRFHRGTVEWGGGGLPMGGSPRLGGPHSRCRMGGTHCCW